MPPVSVDLCSDLGGSFLVIPGAGTVTNRESVWNGPVGAGKGDWESGNGGASRYGWSVLIKGAILVRNDRGRSRLLKFSPRIERISKRSH
jgi:hypothetical protein